ncbi:hypothetical protein SteCoe_21017 [Stentor coeruleus]|uniref:Calcium-dependent protein kinase 1 n=1 Tax=Stentor coeruleus TaxID=5963 RepID=A0A1R2BQL7_9CILI|nr:hypothetical protein SteCoe_21017 [Stentor coeruleus]
MGCAPGRLEEKIDKKSFISINRHISNLQGFIIDPGMFVGKRKGEISKYYNLEFKLGQGAFGLVRAATSILTGKKRAIKSISKSMITNDMKDKTKFFSEVDILIKTDHPNILKLHEFFEDEKYYHLVMEYITGGELLDFILKRKFLTEAIAAKFMKQLLSGIAYCHSNNIVHRDLKLENLLLDSDSPDALLKIIDFGTSQIFKPRIHMTEKYGTILYIAPEVLKGRYNEKCDIWSCGVILYTLLSGRPPFTGENDEEVLQKISRGLVSFDRPIWASISSSAKSLLRKMLTKDPSFRISAEGALHHDWIVQNTSKPILDQQIQESQINSLENLKNFRAECKLQQAVLTFIASQIENKDESKKLINAFHTIDKNGDGKLSKEELIDAYKLQMGQNRAISEVEAIIKKVDVNKSGFIDYTEFIIASSKTEMLLCNSNLEDAFKVLDMDNSGKISAKELKGVLGGRLRAKEELWKKLINEVDENGDGELDISEFKMMMLKLIDAHKDVKA